MKRKFETRASALFSCLDRPPFSDTEINLPEEHPLSTLSYTATTKVETHIQVDPRDVQLWLKEYECDPHFSEVNKSFPEEPPFTFKGYHRNTEGLIFFGDHSGRL